MTEPYPARL